MQQSNATAIKFGVISGLIYLLLSIVLWTLGIGTYASFLTWYTWLPVIFIIILVGGFQRRKETGGFLTFKDALKYAFLAYVIYELFYAGTTILLYNILDKNLGKNVMEHTLESVRKMMERFGASEEQIDKAMERAKEQSAEQGFKQIITGLGIGLILDFIKSLIISLIIRKEKSPEDLLRNS